MIRYCEEEVELNDIGHFRAELDLEVQGLFVVCKGQTMQTFYLPWPDEPPSDLMMVGVSEKAAVGFVMLVLFGPASLIVLQSLFAGVHFGDFL